MELFSSTSFAMNWIRAARRLRCTILQACSIILVHYSVGRVVQLFS